MLDSLRSALTGNLLALLFVTVGAGYLLSHLRVKGLSLGVAAVLFVGLGLGMWGGTGYELPEILGQLGLLLFVYTIGLQAGPMFFRILRRRGLGLTLLAVAAVGATGLLAALVCRVLHVAPAMAIGLFCGSITNTPALAAVTEALRGRPEAVLPTVGYSIAYPMGVIVPLLLSEAVLRGRRIDLPRAVRQAEGDAAEFQEAPVALNLAVTSEGWAGKPIAESPLSGLPLRISRVVRGDHQAIARPETVLQRGDVLRVVGSENAVREALAIAGLTRVEGPGPEIRRDEVDFRRMIVSNPDLVGRRLSEIDLEHRFEAIVTRVRRGDQDFLPGDDTVIERGDRVRVVARIDQLKAIAEYLGDSVRAYSETDFLSLSLGIVIGLALGSVRIPLPGGFGLQLGLAGGPLVASLILGWLGRSGPMVWSLPLAANMAFRQLGLVLFFAAVGLRSGHHFAAAIAAQGPLLVAVGAGMTLVSTAILLGGAMLWLKMDWVSANGALAGGQTQPALLSFAGERSHSEAPAIVYSAIMPTAMVAKILVAQLLFWLL